jgi:probable rRNA maturation factor
VSVEIANESGVDVNEASLAALARHVLDQLRVHPLAELSVLLVDEAAMTDLHQRWLGEPGPTDVLAFPMDELRAPPPGGSKSEHGADGQEVPGLLGDVVLCPQVAVEQACKAEHSVQEELDLLCTHGILHLLGYDHAEPDEHATMFGLQDRLLASWRSERDAQGDSARPAGPDRKHGPAARPGPDKREHTGRREKAPRQDGLAEPEGGKDRPGEQAEGA